MTLQLLTILAGALLGALCAGAIVAVKVTPLVAQLLILLDALDTEHVRLRAAREEFIS